MKIWRKREKNEKGHSTKGERKRRTGKRNGTKRERKEEREKEKLKGGTNHRMCDGWTRWKFETIWLQRYQNSHDENSTNLSTQNSEQKVIEKEQNEPLSEIDNVVSWYYH